MPRVWLLKKKKKREKRKKEKDRKRLFHQSIILGFNFQRFSQAVTL